METQTLTQTINIIIGGDGLANTGASTTLYTIIGAGLIIVAALFLFRHSRNSHFKLGNLTKNRNLNFRGLSIFFLLALFTASLTLSPLSGTISAAPTLSLDTNQEALTVTVPEGGGTASTTTTLTTGTANSSGYTLTASLAEAEPGISIKLRGGSITTATALNAGDPALTLKTTESTTSNDTTEVTLDFTIDSTVTAGTKDLKLAYAISDNEATGPTMQSFTPEQCDALTTYTGTNEEAIIELTDSRGGTTRTYQVAKLADDNCWMLTNLKLGSTTSSITLTPSDTNIASNLTLPQLSTFTFTEEPDEATINDLTDNPHVYGPVPGDTGTGATNYGYLYNWSAATGGESRTSHTEADGDAPYSICPANWRLPTTRAQEVLSDALSLVVYTDGAYSTGGTWSLEITAPITAMVGPFAYNVDGDTVAAALQVAVGETVTTNTSGIVEGAYEATFSWESLDDTWEIGIDLSDIEQENGPGLYDARVTRAGTVDYEFTGDYPDLDQAFGGTGEGSYSGEPNIAQWQYDGAFKGVFSGGWFGEFGGQGVGGVFWSASARPGAADGAFYAYFYATGVSPAVGNDRFAGFSVRCLLQ